MKFFIPCTPPKGTAQQKGAFAIGKRVHFYKKKVVKQAEDSLIALFREHQPESPIVGPVRVSLHWTYPYRKTEKKALVKLGAEIPHDSRPDVDNVAKLAVDCLTLLRFIEDDSKVCELRLSKSWGARPGIQVEIERALTF